MTVMAAEAGEKIAASAATKAASKAAPKKASSKKASVPATPSSKKKDASFSLASFFTGGGRYSEKHYRRILAAEFTFGIVLLTWENLTDQQPLQVTVNGVTHSVPHMKQFGAWAVAFFLLALLTTGGTRMAKISSQIGMLMLGALMLRPVSDGKGGTTFAGSNMLAALAALFSDKSKASGSKKKRSSSSGGRSSGGDSVVQIPGVTPLPAGTISFQIPDVSSFGTTGVEV